MDQEDTNLLNSFHENETHEQRRTDANETQGGEESDSNVDEEDILKREEYDVAESVAKFIDESMIGRNTIPENAIDEEDPLVLRDRRIQKETCDRLGLGRTFFTGFEFKETVLDHALRRGENIKQDRWEKNKLGFRCAMNGNCKWRVYCSFDEPKQLWVLKSKNACHSCTPNGKCSLLKSPTIARLFMDKLRLKPEYMPLDIQRHIKDHWKLVSSRGQCQRGRTIALNWLNKEYAQQFAHLRGYVEELKTSNEGSTAFIETISNAAGEDVFNRFYVCLSALRGSWTYCRPIIGVDGTFLKVAVKGILLTAVAHDANNQIYPIAWAVVQSENTDNWLWFFSQLKIDLDLRDGSGYVIISDRSKGLKSAVNSVLPNIEHRKCVKHIVENLKKNHSNKDLLKPLVWKLAWSYNSTEYEENLRKMKDYSFQLYEDVMKEEPKTWCRAFYKLGSFCEDVDNNATESFNATIVKARAKAMVPMLETIRRQAMERVAKRKKKILNHQGKFSKYVTEVLSDEKADASRCITYRGTHGMFEVELDGNAYDVNTARGTCSCGKWQISGIPCEHAYGAMMDASYDVENYVSPFFSIDVWREIYETAPFPVRGPQFWMNSRYRLITAPPEPILPGRKKKQKNFPRIKGKFESPKKKKEKATGGTLTVGRKGRTMHCSKCGEVNHNAAGCKKHPKKKMKSQMLVEADATSTEGPDTITLTQPTQPTQ